MNRRFFISLLGGLIVTLAILGAVKFQPRAFARASPRSGAKINAAFPLTTTTPTSTPTLTPPTPTLTPTSPTSTPTLTPPTPTLTLTPPPPPPLSISFNQLNWLADDGNVRFANSRVASASFSFTSGARQLLDANGGGFLNVVTDTGSGPQWSVQNLYLTYHNRKELMHAHPNVQFGFPVANGTRVSQIAYAVRLTKKPLTQIALTPPLNLQAEVLLRDYLVGGINEGGSGGADGLLNIGAWNGCPNVNKCAPNQDTMGRVLVATDKLPAVNEDKMGCAPAAAARSIKYMKGDTVGDVQNIYDGLKAAMGTNDTTGTSDASILSGKRKYTKDNKLGITSNMVSWSKSEAVLASSALDSGGDVEALIKWSGKNIGHMVMITSITQIDKTHFQIKYIDDPVQGDGKAENQEHVITVNRDGTFEGGQISHLMIETKNK